MPSIGGINFLKLLGPSPRPTAEEFVEITQDGHDGHELIGLGKRGKRIQIIGEVDAASASSAGDSAVALIGTFVTVVTREGKSISNVFVWDAEIAGARKVLSPVGGVSAGVWIVGISFVLQPMGL